MLELFAQNNRDLALFGGGDKIIVALSGGVDSMVLAELMLQSGVACVFAHCNFHLRGKASDDDERFVCRYAEQKGVILYVQHFDTENYAAQNDLSIEMAARDLRYAWFEELRRQLAYDKIALAHHADDQIETFFINLLRGSGINGLKAMKPVNGRLIRPLLWASRAGLRIMPVAMACSGAKMPLIGNRYICAIQSVMSCCQSSTASFPSAEKPSDVPSAIWLQKMDFIGRCCTID